MVKLSVMTDSGLRTARGVNYARLKLELLLYGAAVEETLAARIQAFPSEELPVTRRRVGLIFPDGTRVLAPLEQGSPYHLRNFRDGVVELTGRDVTVDAFSTLSSDFHQRVTRLGRSYSEIGQVSGGYFFLPLGAKPDVPMFSTALVNGEERHEIVFHDLREVHELMAAAFGEGLVDVVKIAVKLPNAFDEDDVMHLLPYLQMIKRNFKSFVYLSIPPPADDRLLPLLYARGVDVIFCDILLTDDERAKMHLPFRRYYSAEQVYETLARLTNIFPQGAVLSRVLMGWESLERTEQAIERLVSIGAVPVINMIPAGRDRLSSVVLSAIHDLLMSMHHDINPSHYSRWMHSHLMVLADGFTPMDSLLIDRFERGSGWVDRMILSPFSRRCLEWASELRRSVKVQETEAPSLDDSRG